MRFFYCTQKQLKPSPFSRLIMRVIGADYSHSLLLVEDAPLEDRMRLGLPLDGPLIFHATIPRYNWTTLASEIASGGEIVEKIEIKVRNPLAALYWLDGNRGKSYSLEQCLGFLSVGLAEVWGNCEGEGVCSEIPVRFGSIHSTRPDFFSGMNLEFVNPKQGVAIFESLRLLTK